MRFSLPSFTSISSFFKIPFQSWLHLEFFQLILIFIPIFCCFHILEFMNQFPSHSFSILPFFCPRHVSLFMLSSHCFWFPSFSMCFLSLQFPSFNSIQPIHLYFSFPTAKFWRRLKGKITTFVFGDYMRFQACRKCAGRHNKTIKMDLLNLHAILAT